MLKSRIPRQWLIHAAKELNKEMGLDPAIDLDADDDELADLIQAASEFVKSYDEYTVGLYGFH